MPNPQELADKQLLEIKETLCYETINQLDPNTLISLFKQASSEAVNSFFSNTMLGHMPVLTKTIEVANRAKETTDYIATGTMWSLLTIGSFAIFPIVTLTWAHMRAEQHESFNSIILNRVGVAGLTVILLKSNNIAFFRTYFKLVGKDESFKERLESAIKGLNPQDKENITTKLGKIFEGEKNISFTLRDMVQNMSEDQQGFELADTEPLAKVAFKFF